CSRVRVEQPGGGVRGERAEERGAERDPGHDLADHARLAQRGEQRAAEVRAGDHDGEGEERSGVGQAWTLPRTAGAYPQGGACARPPCPAGRVGINEEVLVSSAPWPLRTGKSAS